MEKLQHALIPSIRMGEMRIGRDGDELRTLLGSCIGLSLYDRRNAIGGLAHIVLPRANGATDLPAKFADTAIPALVAGMRELTSGTPALTAKIAGGASMFSTKVAVGIGVQNLEACKEQLRALRIPIVAEHCGGDQGRRMTFHTGTGTVLVELVGQDPITL